PLRLDGRRRVLAPIDGGPRQRVARGGGEARGAGRHEPPAGEAAATEGPLQLVYERLHRGVPCAGLAPEAADDGANDHAGDPSAFVGLAEPTFAHVGEPGIATARVRVGAEQRLVEG